MSDDSVRAALRSEASLVLVEAPAGCGKTHQGADYARETAVADQSIRPLILTHTHAACSVFADRTKGIGPRVEIRTIDSVIGHIASAYHKSLGLPPDIAMWIRQRDDGYAGKPKEITIWDDAPENLRFSVLETARELDWGPSALRTTICRVLRTPPNQGNWSEYPNIWDEVQNLMYGCDWFRVYDIIEALHARMQENDRTRGENDADSFATELNRFFLEEGIGWQIQNGEIVTRGSEAFEAAVHTAVSELQDAGRLTAAARIQEALYALSRRPEPDLAGAISHAIAALECVAGDITGDQNATFGDFLKKHPDIFGSMKKGLEGLWGYACNEGARHGKEGVEPAREEAELVVNVSASVVAYLNRKHK